MESLIMQLEVIRGETLGELNKCFRLKVQLQEQLDENEVLIHFKRGIMDGLEQAQNAIKKSIEADKIEKIRAERIQEIRDKDDGHSSINKVAEALK